VSIGCAQCHVPSYRTGVAASTAASHQLVKPYSDFLLHDMGQLGDGIVQGAAGATEIRTPALWGLRLRPLFLHDGRVGGGTFADRVNQTVAEHGATGSEAVPAATAYAALSAADKDAVIRFLDSLGRAEFDSDGDIDPLTGTVDIDLNDFNFFRGCYEGGPYDADDPCAIGDIDQDGEVDLFDFSYFLQAYDLPTPDCNGNMVIDLQDILVGTAPDDDFDGVLDTCAACVTVLDCDDADVCTCDTCGGACQNLPSVYGNVNCQPGVSLDDILCALNGFANYGDCPNADIGPVMGPGTCQRNGVISIDDILSVIGAFAGANPCGCAP
jgi:hypothetical protein